MSRWAIAEALQEAHKHHVLHRDLKPDNVLIPKDGRIRVLDFGISKLLASDGDRRTPSEPVQRGDTVPEVMSANDESLSDELAARVLASDDDLPHTKPLPAQSLGLVPGTQIRGWWTTSFGRCSTSRLVSRFWPLRPRRCGTAGTTNASCFFEKATRPWGAWAELWPSMPTACCRE